MTLTRFFHLHLALLKRGRRWWPAELAFRGLGLLLLASAWQLCLLAHRMAMQPPFHPARAGDLGVCAAMIVTLCTGLTLAIAGPGLLRDVPLPAYFTRPPRRDAGHRPLDSAATLGAQAVA